MQMKRKKYIQFTLFLLLGMLTSNVPRTLREVTFKATAPASVVEGEQFRLSYHLNRRDVTCVYRN